MFHLVCHETIPGSGYKRGDNVTDPEAIADILANTNLAQNFSQVPDGTFAVSRQAPQPLAKSSPPPPTVSAAAPTPTP